MSQFPFNPPPAVPYANPDTPDPLRPARHAALLMGILGLLSILLGAGILFAGPSVPADSWPPELQQQISRLETEGQIDYPTVIRVFGLAVAFPGLILLTVAYFVRRGGSIALRIGMVVTVLALLNVGSGLVQSMQMLAAGDLSGIASLIFAVLATGLFVLQFIWLLQARRNVMRGHIGVPVADVAIPPPPEYSGFIPPPPPPRG